MGACLDKFFGKKQKIGSKKQTKCDEMEMASEINVLYEFEKSDGFCKIINSDENFGLSTIV